MSGAAARIWDASRGARPVARSQRRELRDPCDAEGVAARLDSADWFAARVRGGAERRVVERLAERRVFAFTPVNEVWRRVNATDRHKTLFRYPALPGYVIFAIEGRLERWGFVRGCPDVLGYLLSGGRARQFRRREVERLACLGDQAEDFERHMDSREEWWAEPGDALTIIRGPLAGMAARLAEPLWKARSGTVAVEIDGPFGRSVSGRARLRDLRRIGD